MGRWPEYGPHLTLASSLSTTVGAASAENEANDVHHTRTTV